ncbi:unnamed protein product [Arabidopsis lyrata]|nr:unnamed protein product [Arabidopsis lyrata]
MIDGVCWRIGEFSGGCWSSFRWQIELTTNSVGDRLIRASDRSQRSTYPLAKRKFALVLFLEEFSRSIIRDPFQMVLMVLGGGLIQRKTATIFFFFLVVIDWVLWKLVSA